MARGDINTYALGMEFQFSAGDAMKELKNITDQAMNIQKMLSTPQKMAIDNADIKVNEEISQQSIETHKEINALFKDRISETQSAYDALKDLTKQGLSYEELQKATSLDYAKIRDELAKLAPLYHTNKEDYKELADLTNKYMETQDRASAMLTDNKKAWDDWSEGSRIAIKQSSTAAKGMLGIIGEFSPLSKEILEDTMTLLDTFGAMPESLGELFLGTGEGYNQAMQQVGDFSKEMKERGSIHPSMSGSWEEFQKSIGNVGSDASTAAGNIAGSIANVGDAASGMQSGVKGATAALGGIGSKAAGATKAVGGFGGAAGGAGGALGGMGGAAGAAGGALAKANPYIMAAQIALKFTGKAAQAAGQALDAMGMSGSRAGGAVSKAIKESKGIPILFLFKAAINLVTAALQDFTDTQEAVRLTSFRAIGTIDDATDSIADLRAELALSEAESRKVITGFVNAGATLVSTRKEMVAMTKQTAMFSKATGVSEDSTAAWATQMKAAGRTVGDVETSLSMFTVAMKRTGMSAQEVERILKKLVAIGPQLRALFDTRAPEQYASALLGLTEEFKKLGGGLEQATELMKAAEDPFGKVAIMSGVAGSGIKNLTQRTAAMADGIMAGTAGWKSFGPVQKKITAGVYGVSAATIDLLHRMKAQGKTMDEITKKYSDMATEAKKNQEVQKSFDEAISTLKQELMRLFEPILAVIVKGFKPLASAISKVLVFIKPLVSAISWLINLFDKLKIIQFAVYGVMLLMLPVAVALASAFLAIAIPMGLILLPLIAIGAALWAAYKIGKIVFAPLIFAAKVVWKILKVVWGAIKDIAGAIWDGIGDAFNAVIKPLSDAFADLKKAFIEAKEAIFGASDASSVWSDIMKGLAKVVAFVIKVAFFPLILLAKLIGLAIKGIAAVIRGLFAPVKKATGFFATLWEVIKVGLKIIFAPVYLTIKLIQWLWKTIKDGISTVKKPFELVKAGIDKVGKAIEFLAKPFIVVGKAAGWLVGKLFGSGFLHIEEGAAGAGKAIDTLGKDFDKMGKKSISPTVSVLQEMVGPTIGQRISRLLSPLGGMFGLGGGGRAVKREIDQEMGREPPEAKAINKLGEKIDDLQGVIRIIVEMIAESKDPSKIYALLEEYLPKMAERPAELGPDVSRW